MSSLSDRAIFSGARLSRMNCGDRQIPVQPVAPRKDGPAMHDRNIPTHEFMLPIPLLAVAAKAHTSVLDAFPHLAGMLMVMVTLTILWGVCALTAKLIQLLLPAPVAATPPQPAAHRETNTIAPEIVAVIAAAVAATTGSQQRIVSIKYRSSTWEKAGRQSVLSSHRIR